MTINTAAAQSTTHKSSTRTPVPMGHTPYRGAGRAPTPAVKPTTSERKIYHPGITRSATIAAEKEKTSNTAANVAHKEAQKKKTAEEAKKKSEALEITSINHNISPVKPKPKTKKPVAPTGPFVSQ